MTEIAATLARYGEYHRDRRNIATHAIGIPLIVLAVEVLLSRPFVPVGGIALTPAIVVSALASVFYLRLDVRIGLVMTALLAIGAAIGFQLGQLPPGRWLALGLGMFVIGWAFQLLGHHYEGRKPAFIDDLKSLLIGPLFVVAEGAFALGLFSNLRREIERGR